MGGTSRRGRGEGSIYQDSRGLWRAVVDLGWQDGRRCRKYLSGRTRAEVARKLRAAQAAADAGQDLHRTDGRLTVRAWMTHWLDDIAAARVRPSTLAAYRGYVHNRVLPAIGNVRLTALQPEHLDRVYRDLLADGMAPASVLQVHRIISRSLKVAVQRGKVPRNVATLVDAPTVHRPEAVALSADQARAVLTAAADWRNRPRWTIALLLGLRQGEALGLAWDAVDLDRGILTVRQALQRLPARGLVLVPPKSRAGRRVLPLPSSLVDELREHRQEQQLEREAAGNLWRHSGLVFTTVLGGPIEPKADNIEWHRILDRAGVPSFRLHDARHTAATLLLEEGVPARVAMEILGHSQIALTLDTYSHVAPHVASEAVSAVAGRMTVVERRPAAD